MSRHIRTHRWVPGFTTVNLGALSENPNLLEEKKGITSSPRAKFTSKMSQPRAVYRWRSLPVRVSILNANFPPGWFGLEQVKKDVVVPATRRVTQHLIRAIPILPEYADKVGYLAFEPVYDVPRWEPIAFRVFDTERRFGGVENVNPDTFNVDAELGMLAYRGEPLETALMNVWLESRDTVNKHVTGRTLEQAMNRLLTIYEHSDIERWSVRVDRMLKGTKKSERITLDELRKRKAPIKGIPIIEHLEAIARLYEGGVDDFDELARAAAKEQGLKVPTVAQYMRTYDAPLQELGVIL